LVGRGLLAPLLALALALARALTRGAGPAAAQVCRLALSLGLDVSSSVDSREYALQRKGLIVAPPSGLLYCLSFARGRVPDLTIHPRGLLPGVFGHSLDG
jgi:hypothetical protein